MASVSTAVSMAAFIAANGGMSVVGIVRMSRTSTPAPSPQHAAQHFHGMQRLAPCSVVDLVVAACAECADHGGVATSVPK